MVEDKRYVTVPEEQRSKSEEEQKDERAERYVAKELNAYVLTRKEEPKKEEDEALSTTEYMVEHVEAPATTEIMVEEKSDDVRRVETASKDEEKDWLVQEWEEHGLRVKERKEREKASKKHKKDVK